MKGATVLLGALLWLSTCLAAWFGLFLLDNLFRLPPALRLPLVVAGGTLTVYGIFRHILSPARRKTNRERTAIELEGRYDIPGNLLINACQMERQDLSSGERIFADHTIEASLTQMSRIPSASLWNAAALKKWAAAAALAILAWLIYAIALPHQTANAFMRYAMPLRDVPPIGRVTIHTTPATDVTISENGDLTVSVKITRRNRTDQPDGAPLIAWVNGNADVRTGRLPVDNAVMPTDEALPDAYHYTFRMVRRSFSFRVFAADTYSRRIHVRVRPLPRIVSALFRLVPPQYTGLPAKALPGPPASVSCYAGSSLDIVLSLDQAAKTLTWRTAQGTTALARAGGQWTATTRIDASGPYTIELTASFATNSTTIAAGDVTTEPDLPPRIDFALDDRNLLLDPGETLVLPLSASDDLGVKRIDVVAQPAKHEDNERLLKSWTYMGPPGRTGQIRETLTLTADHKLFEPGMAYIIRATCHDFSSGGKPGRSRPVMIRVKSWQDLRVPDSHPLAAVFRLLRQTVAEQKRANALTEKLNVHLADALKDQGVDKHRDAMAAQQRRAQDAGRKTLRLFKEDSSCEPHVKALLGTLVDREMPWVLADIAKLTGKDPAGLPPIMTSVAKRQEHILTGLISLLGEMARAAERSRKKTDEAVDEATPSVTADDAGRALKDDLEDFVRAQERIIKKTRDVMGETPEDLTQEEEDILGELAREEAEWARFLKDKLTDFSKLPMQDFADGSIAEEFNEVLQEVKLAAQSLYDKNVEIAVPQEQSGLESAEELMHNLEKWLPDTPDNIKWSMEEPPGPADVPMAELPDELEDIVGELLDQEEAMTEDVEDVTSSWMDSIDKGAGWDAMDGPISSMSAKGVTGNRLPNEMEVDGRSGEGRTGRSHGQMVEETAEGKGGRETPTRLTPSPFEPGSIEDATTEDTGGATGGGKLSGFTQEGLRGPAPPPRLDKMVRLAGQQAKIRQDAETLALRLRRYNLPTGDLEVSIHTMKQFETAARAGNEQSVRRSFSRVIDALHEAHAAIRTEAGLHRDGSRLPEWARDEIMSGLREGVPRGYEDMVSEYFRVMAERPVPGGRP